MAGLGPAIHVFAAGIKERRGWPAFAGHDDGGAVPAPVEAIIPQRILSESAQPGSRLILMAGLGPAVRVFAATIRPGAGTLVDRVLIAAPRLPTSDRGSVGEPK